MLSLGDEQTIPTPDGREWSLGRLELRHIRGFRDWIEKRVGDPFTTVERYLGKLKDEHLMPMLKEAESTRDQLRSFSMACPLALRFLATEEGLTFVVSALLKGKHEKHTEEEAFLVAQTVADRLAEVLEKAQGRAPNGAGPAEEGRAG